jgi:hypothetical protein
MTANTMRVLYMVSAAVLFCLAYNFGCGGGGDLVRASAIIGFSLGGCVALVAAAIIKKDT